MNRSRETDDQLGAATAVILNTLGDAALAVYVYGSAVVGGLRPASDLDLFVVTERPIVDAERQILIERLTPLSDRDLRPGPWRPLELTAAVRADIDPWRYPPVMDLQWGEWLRSEYRSGRIPQRHANPDLALLLAMARPTGRALYGPPPQELLPPIPTVDVAGAMLDSMPKLFDDLETDTANVLLTLARMWHTIETGQFSAKDVAADWARARVPASEGAVLARARDAYLGLLPGEWDDRSESPRRVAELLREEIVRAADR